MRTVSLSQVVESYKATQWSSWFLVIVMQSKASHVMPEAAPSQHARAYCSLRQRKRARMMGSTAVRP